MREVSVKRKIKAKTKIATLNLPLLNKTQGTPKFARVSESEVGKEETKQVADWQTQAIFEASART